MQTYIFDAKILKHDGMDAAYIEFPYITSEEFGTKGQVKVKAVFDETATYRGSLAKMGLDFHCLGLTKEIRSLLGKQPGDVIHVSLVRDDEPRTVEIPEDVQQELQTLDVLPDFLRLSYSIQKKWISTITSAKKPETRIRNIQKLAAELSSKRQ